MTMKCRRTFLSIIVGAVASLLHIPCKANGAGRFYHPGHNCPSCGTQVVVIYCWGPGQFHTHRHGNTFWYH
jgi:hypothetical protein